MRAGASSVLMLDAKRNKLVFVAAVGDRGDALVGEEFDAQLGIAGYVARTAEPVMVGNARDDKRFFSGIDDMSSFRTESLIAAPMIHKSDVVGVVEVLNPIDGRCFAQPDLDLLRIFANLAAAGAFNARAHQALKRENLGLRQTLLRSDRIIGESKALKQVIKLCDRVAGSNATPGKEILSEIVRTLTKSNAEDISTNVRLLD